MNDQMKLAALEAMAAEGDPRGGRMAPPMAAMGMHEAECPNCGHVFMMGGDEEMY
jgi:hypothetical protein